MYIEHTTGVMLNMRLIQRICFSARGCSSISPKQSIDASIETRSSEDQNLPQYFNIYRVFH